MSGFNNNDRLQDHLMYALDWAIFLRHNIEEQLIPFLFEWEDETIFKNMLNPGGDPEEFAYRIAEKSEKNSDQFVVGYEGMLTDQSGKKIDAFIIKAYDKTQETGVFLAQIFNPIEKSGKFELVDKPMLIGNPKLPFAVNSELTPKYESEELYSSGMVLKNNDQIAILSHPNPSVVASGIKNFLRSKLQGANSAKLSGNLEISIAPQDSFGDFFKYTIIRTIEEELNSDYTKDWQRNNNKSINLICKHGDDVIYSNTKESVKSSNDTKNTKESNDQANEHSKLMHKYNSYSKSQLDTEFYRIASVPNARTNVESLKQMSALIEVYDSKGIQIPAKNTIPKNKSKSGCISVAILLLIAGIALSIV